MKLSRRCGLWCVAGLLTSMTFAFGQVPDTDKAKALPVYHCAEVLDVKMIRVNELGRVRLLGIANVPPGSPGYGKALAAVKKYCLDQDVKIEKCSKVLRDPSGAIRAIVYYQEGGEWYNLNTKLLRAGLASAVKEPQCHVDTGAWAALVQQAQTAKRGFYYLGLPLPTTSKQASSPVPVPEREKNKTKGIQLFRYNEATPVPLNVKYVGSVRSKRFHTLDCLLRPKSERDRCYFTDRETPFRLDFKPCKVCQP